MSPATDPSHESHKSEGDVATDLDNRTSIPAETLLGWLDDMLLIRGTNVYPRAIEAIVREYQDIDEFRIVVETTEAGVDEITVVMEVRAESSVLAEDNAGQLFQTIQDDLIRNHEGLRINVESAETGALPRFELKAKRLEDRRSQS